MAGKREETNRNPKVKGRKRAIFFKVTLIIVLLAVAITVFELAPNYKKNYVKDKTNLIINNNNVTEHMKEDIYVDENKTIYLSMADVDNYFDGNITYDEKYNQIITTYETKVASLVVGEKKVTINGVEKAILAPAIKKDATYYLPFSELGEVYNADVKYNADADTFVIVSRDRKLVKADAVKKLSVRALEKTLSASVAKVQAGEKVIIISEGENWTRIRTEKGRMGYVKTKDIANAIAVREQMDEIKTRLDEKVNLVWDYYYATAPDRSGQKINGVNVVSPSFFELEDLGRGAIIDKTSQSYIAWAKSNGYKIWPMFSNNGMIQTTSEILNDYKLRGKVIEDIVDLVLKYDLDGINLDFENMYKDDKDVFSRFVIELAPRLKEYGRTLSVDVTAPDGSETWSECYNRNLIGNVSDYIIFMAYDQYGPSSPKAGSVAGFDWVELSLDKFINREEVKPEKLILAIPFYTRLWKEQNGSLTGSSAVNMNNINTVLPSTADRVWDEVTRQYYTEYVQGRHNV